MAQRLYGCAQVAAGLNGQQMGGKRRSRHHFDLWSLKYLPKFKWEHLTEEIGKLLCSRLPDWPMCMPGVAEAGHSSLSWPLITWCGWSAMACQAASLLTRCRKALK